MGAGWCLCGPTNARIFKESELQGGASRSVGSKARGSVLAAAKETEHVLDVILIMRQRAAFPWLFIRIHPLKQIGSVTQVRGAASVPSPLLMQLAPQTWELRPSVCGGEAGTQRGAFAELASPGCAKVAGLVCLFLHSSLVQHTLIEHLLCAGSVDSAGDQTPHSLSSWSPPSSK